LRKFTLKIGTAPSRNEEKNMKKLATLASTALMVLGLAAGSAVAGSGVRVGVLSCHVYGGVGWIIGSTKSANCVFRSAHGGWKDYYGGSITRVGIDVGVTNGTHLVWAVFAPGKMKRGSLAGGYAGAGAEATIGVGLGANVLIGGFRKSINLQPLSVQGQTGLNIAGGIGSLTLRRR
jgi:Protein of unknown function (DUF992)